MASQREISFSMRLHHYGFALRQSVFFSEHVTVSCRAQGSLVAELPNCSKRLRWCDASSRDGTEFLGQHFLPVS
jgi:hypothetical protein